MSAVPPARRAESDRDSRALPEEWPHDHEQGRGVVDFYRELINAIRRALPLSFPIIAPVVAEVALIAGNVALRTADAPRVLMLGWTGLLAATAVACPLTALVVLLALAPFSEWLVINGVGAKVVIIATIGVGLTVRLAIGRRAVGSAPLSIRLAVVLLAATAFSVLVTMINRPSLGTEATIFWLTGIGGGLVVMIAAWAAATRGSVRPLATAVGALIVGAAASLLDFAAGGVVRASMFDWLLRPLRLELPRVTGIIPASNAVATVLVAALAVVVAVLVTRTGWWRVVLGAAAGLLGATIVFTYSRSGLVGIVVIALLLVAARRPRLAVVMLGIGIALAVIVVPAYLRFRAAALGSGDIADLGALLTGDVRRFEGWVAAIRMWLAAPLTGFGALTFRELAPEFGSTYVTAPHNELLRFLAEGGIGVAAAFVLFVAATGRELWRSKTPIALGALGALAGLMIGGMFNNPFIYVQVMAPTFAILGAAIGTAGPPGPEPLKEMPAIAVNAG